MSPVQGAGDSGIKIELNDERLNSRVRQRRFSVDDRWAGRGHRTVQVDERVPGLRHVVFVKNGLDEALRDAGLAVDAIVGCDVEHPVPLAEAVARADDNAIGIFAIDARLGHDKSHGTILPGTDIPARTLG